MQTLVVIGFAISRHLKDFDSDILKILTLVVHVLEIYCMQQTEWHLNKYFGDCYWNIGQLLKCWHISRSFGLEIYWKQQTDWHLNKNIWEHYYWNSGQFLKCCHLWIVSYWNVISRSFVLEFYWKHQSIHAARSSSLSSDVQMFKQTDVGMKICLDTWLCSVLQWWQLHRQWKSDLRHMSKRLLYQVWVQILLVVFW